MQNTLLIDAEHGRSKDSVQQRHAERSNSRDEEYFE